MTNLDVARASAADLPFIMATERMDGYDALVGRWDQARHLSAFNDPSYAYFLARDAEHAVGFAIVRGWGVA